MEPLKMSTRDFSWGKGGRCVRPTTYYPCSAEHQENPGTPWATSACCGMTFTFTFVSIQVSDAYQKPGYSNYLDYSKICYWSFQMTKTQCLLFVPIYSVRWRNRMDSMCLISRRFILNICVRSVNIWVTTVVVCRSNTIGLSSHHCGSLLMEAVHTNSLQ